MLSDIELPLIMIAAFIAMASPGPATLAIAGTAMKSGRTSGLALAAGITTGSFMWSVAAALGLGAIMLANTWVFEVIRYFGTAYLLFLAYKSARSALTNKPMNVTTVGGRKSTLFSKGLLLHLTNPKAILFFGSLYSIGVPPDTPPESLVIVIAALGMQSFLICHGYAILFSSQRVAQAYLRLRRWLEGLFAMAFGAAALKILLTRIQPS